MKKYERIEPIYILENMKKSLILFTLILTSFTSLAFAAREPFLFGMEEPSQHILLNNRILAIVNGKPISVVDVMKKMDVLFYKQYPQYTSNNAARFQFYKINWKKIVQDLIDKELILADAQEAKVKVTSGEIRKEMESTFGPNIIINLDKAGITFDDAWKMMEDDILLRRMVGFRAQLKAIKRITPQVVKTAYEEFAKNNVQPEKWDYQVIAIRDVNPEKGAEQANLVYQRLIDGTTPSEELPKVLEALDGIESTTKITVSELFSHEEKELSPAYKAVLTTLNTNSYSSPITQKSKDKSTVFRIFYLKERTPGGAPLFSAIGNKIKYQLLEEAIEEETIAYFERLRKHYHVHENGFQDLIAEGFEPFILK